VFGYLGSVFTLSLVSQGNLPLAATLVSVSVPSLLLPSLTAPKALFIVGGFGM